MQDAGTPLVSVLMLTINRPQYIGPAIESVRRQTFAGWELLVIHDGDDPSIPGVVANFVAQDRRIAYHHRPVIGNIANALNHGIRLSRGRYLSILDDDDAWTDPDKLRRQVELLERDHALACIGGGALVIDAAGLTKLVYGKPPDDAGCRQAALVANPIIHSTATFRRTAAEEVGLYDEGLAGYQDWDLWLKLMRKWRVMNLPEPLATYRVWDGGGSSRNVRANAWSGLRIVWRHRTFPGASFGLASACCYVLFSLAPAAIRRPMYQSLSQVKKRLFSRGLRPPHAAPDAGSP